MNLFSFIKNSRIFKWLLMPTEKTELNNCFRKTKNQKLFCLMMLFNTEK